MTKKKQKAKHEHASFDRRRVHVKQSVMGRAVQPQETRKGQKRNAAQEARDSSLGFDLRRRARLSANVLVDRRSSKRARDPLQDEERMLAQWHRERQRTRKFSLGDDDGGGRDESAESRTLRSIGLLPPAYTARRHPRVTAGTQHRHRTHTTRRSRKPVSGSPTTTNTTSNSASNKVLYTSWIDSEM